MNNKIGELSIGRMSLSYFYFYFYGGFISGILDKRKPAWRNNENDAVLIKQIASDYYEHFSIFFCNVSFPILLSINFDSYEAAMADMNKHHFSNDTPVKLLLRYACQSKELYDVMIKTYQKELTSLLEGRFLSEIENKGKYFQRAYLESHEFGFRAESNKK